MNKLKKIGTYLLCFAFCLSLVSGTVVVAASPAKQLEKGISLFNENKDTKAMDYFIDVLVNGNADQVAQANRYIEKIHNRMGGIQTPVEVDVNFQEGEVKSIEDMPQTVVQQAQEQAQQEAQALRAAQEEAAQTVAAKQQEALAAVEAQQQALTDRIEAERLAAEKQAQAARDAAAAQAQEVLTESVVAPVETAVGQTVADAQQTAANTQQAAQQTVAGVQQTAANAQQAAQQTVAAGQETLAKDWETASTALNEQQVEMSAVAATLGDGKTAQEDFEAVADQTTAQLNAAHEDMTAKTNGQSLYADLTSPEAIEARELYTAQKIASMRDAAIKRLTDAKGVQLYMRDDKPDALDVDPEVIFDKNAFRTDAQPLLNDIYELLALTQGSAYVILPPGSYTDDVSLSGIRQAMALNSYLVNRGISQGKLHYNMGLVDEEPPARFANLHGLGLVFDYDAKLPTVMEKNANNETAPLLSMAIVPLCHAIDRSLGEAFAIDFSVLETVNPLDNWLLQVVQHGTDGKYYIVRQLEGFAPVYHQILFNGRKGIIGPELPCGKYTLVLTGTDLKGNKQTLRRRVIVKCADAANTCDGSCATKKVEAVKTVAAETTELDYKNPRLWNKPGRKMMKVRAAAPAAVADSTSTKTVAKTVSTTTIIEEDDGTDEIAAMQAAPSPAATQTPSADYSYGASATVPTNNPYDMPYEEYND